MLHEAPVSVFSDKDPLFISKFWREFIGHLGVEQDLSSSYHPHSDGQSEVLNRCLENYLQVFTWQYSHTWSRWLPLDEWWYNTTYHSAINSTPYEVVYGQAPPVVEVVDRSFTVREEMLRTLKDNLRKAVHIMKQQADKG